MVVPLSSLTGTEFQGLSPWRGSKGRAPWPCLLFDQFPIGHKKKSFLPSAAALNRCRNFLAGQADIGEFAIAET